MNRVIKLLLISDVFTITGFGFLEPIFAIFIKEDLIGGSVFAVGLASSLFFITKSIIQVPFSKHVDSHDDADDLRWLIIGAFLIAVTPFIYFFVRHVYFIYAAQVVYGIGAGLAYPAWLGLWSTHLDKKRESFEWSLYSAMVGVGVAITAFIGGAIGQYIGFQYVFIMTGVMAVIGCLILIDLLKNKTGLNYKTAFAYHRKRKIVPRSN